MTAPGIRVGAGWLALREPADAAARAPDLVGHLKRQLPATDRQVIHDLGCGTGAMGRWLAPLLPGPQHWVLHDRDAELLEVAAAEVPGPAADGSAVSVEDKHSDITRLQPGDLADATLIAASALLDLLTKDELARLVTVCAGAGCPMLLTLSVAGRVSLTPPDPLDRRVADAFDAHQRRATERGRLLGPDAVALAVEEFGRVGSEVLVRPSPWRLDAAQADLAAQWFAGWVGAACEQQSELAAETDVYTRRRLAQATAGRLAVTVDHADLLVLPRAGGSHPADSGTWSVCAPLPAFAPERLRLVERALGRSAPAGVGAHALPAACTDDHGRSSARRSSRASLD
jgi:SAM-dependent methyltransferase